VLRVKAEAQCSLSLSRLAGDFLKSSYLFVAVGQVGGACRDVQQTILQVGQYSKREKLVEILRNIGTSF
jgi:probable ATP-dependent RNA helicase DDX4